MDQTRRDFFRDLGAKTAGVAATVITPTLAHAEQLGEQIREVSSRIDASALMLSYQQTQIHLLFLLLVVSFAIDGGMTFFWLL